MRKCLLITILSFMAALPLRAEVWERLFKLPAEQRLDTAAQIRQQLSETLDSAGFMAQMDVLKKMAMQKGDKELEVMSTFFRGIYHVDYRNDVYDTLAIHYFRESLAKAERYELDKISVSILNVLGYSLLKRNEKTEGITRLLQSEKLLQEIGYDQVSDAYKILFRIGAAYAIFGNTDRAIHHLELALKYGNPDKKALGVIQNQLASSWLLKEDYKKALLYYEQALKSVEEAGDSVSIAKISANIGSLYVDLRMYDKAEEVLREAYTLNIKTGCWNCVGVVLLRSMQIELSRNKLQAVHENRNELIRLLNHHKIKNLNLWAGYYQETARLFIAEKKHESASLYLDSLLVLKDSISNEKDASTLANLEAQLAAESFLAEKKENQRQRMLRNASWVISGLTILLLGGLLYGFRMRQKRLEQQEQIILLEKQRAEEQTEHYRHKLKSFIEGVREKNQLIEQLQTQLEQNTLPVNGQNGILPVPGVMGKLYEAIILTEEDWLEFKKMFDKVYPGFIRAIQVRYAKLTVAEVRFLVLLRLNLTVPEMANMLGISRESVNRTSQRIRKKLGFTSSDELLKLVGELSVLPEFA